MFDGRICVVTGGAKGIGKNIVQEFARRRANVAFIDIDKEAGKKLEKEVRERFGVNVFFFHGDLRKEEDIELFAAAVIGQHDKIDYLVNNACISRGGILSGCGYEEFEEVLRVGVTAPYTMTKAFKSYFYMGGCVVNIASTRAFMSQRDTESYSAAKGAIVSMTHALAASFQGKIRVNCVSPGWIENDETAENGKVDKEQHISGKIGVPFDVTRTVMFLCEGKADFINGQNITVDGGMTKMMIYHGEGGWSFRRA